MNYISRKAIPSDLDELYNIWNVTFGDSYAEIGLCLDYFFDYELSHVIECENKVVAMGILLPVGELVIGDKGNIPCAMIYAVATLSEYRGYGFGSIISRELISTAREIGYPAVVLCPANDKLFDFYGKSTDMIEKFYLTEYSFSAPINSNKHFELHKISASEYITLRENLLNNIAHIKYNLNTLEYQSNVCDVFGGGLYQINTSLGIACAVVESESDDLIHIKELLFSNYIQSSDNHLSQLQNIASDFLLEFFAKECKIRMPVINGVKKRFAMLALPNDLQQDTCIETAPAWYGLAFD